MSTALARRLETEHARRGQQFVSAPVFGRLTPPKLSSCEPLF